MKKETIAKIIRTILRKDIEFNIDYFPYEESKGHYKNIYKIVSGSQKYVLKKAKGNELDCYQFINNSVNSIPYFYGSYHYYGSDYILIEYIEGENAIKMDRTKLVKTIDAIIKAQKLFWKSKDTFGVSLESAVERIENRFKYLPNELKDTYSKYIDCFKKTLVTFSHEDLLPFNVLLSKDRVCFIDLEVMGILPYPTMLARLLAFTEEKDDALFFLKKEDYGFAINYYYDNFIKEQGISKHDYLLTFNLFVYNELIEWVYVYQKNHYPLNAFYNKWYQKALQKQNELLSLM